MKTRASTNVCPYCATEQDSASCLSGDSSPGPKSGDMLLCAACSRWIVRDTAAPGNARRPNAAEQRRLDSDPFAALVSEQWRKIKEGRS